MSWLGKNIGTGAFIFPLKNFNDDTVGFQVRGLSEKKYNTISVSPEGLFPMCFGFQHTGPHIFRSECAIVVEGVFDFFSVRKLAFNVIAVLTSNISNVTLTLLSRICKNVVLLLDMDNAGRDGVARFLKKDHGLIVSAPSYSTHDPSDLYTEGKTKELSRILTGGIK